MGSRKAPRDSKVLTAEDLDEIAAREGFVANEHGQFSIQELSLERNQLTSLGNAFRLFPFIRQLDLSRNNLRSLQGVQHLPNLRKLSLYYNQIEDGKELFTLKNHESLEELDLRLNAITRAELYRLFVVQHLPRLKILDQRTIREQERQRIQGAPKISPSDLFAEEYEEFENKEYVTDNDEISPTPTITITTSPDAKDPMQDRRDAEGSEIQQTEGETGGGPHVHGSIRDQLNDAHEEDHNTLRLNTSHHDAAVNSAEDLPAGRLPREETETKADALPPLPSTVGHESGNGDGPNGTVQRNAPRRNGSPARSAPRPPQRGRTSSSGGVWWRAQVADYPEESVEVGDEGEADPAKGMSRVDALLDQLSNSIHAVQSEPGDAELWQQSIVECRELLEEIAIAREDEVKGQKNEILQLRAQNERSLDQLRVRMQSSVIPRLAEADEDVARLMEERNNLKAELDSRNDERSLSDRHVKSDLEDDFESPLEDEIRQLRTELEASKAERDALLRDNETLSQQQLEQQRSATGTGNVADQATAFEMLKEVHESLVNSNRVLLEELRDTKARHEQEIQQWNRNFELLKEHYKDLDS